MEGCSSVTHLLESSDFVFFAEWELSRHLNISCAAAIQIVAVDWVTSLDFDPPPMPIPFIYALSLNVVYTVPLFLVLSHIYTWGLTNYITSVVSHSSSDLMFSTYWPGPQPMIYVSHMRSSSWGARGMH